MDLRPLATLVTRFDSLSFLSLGHRGFVWSGLLGLGLACCLSAGSPGVSRTPIQLEASSGRSEGFTRLHSRQTGVRFANRLSDKEAAANQIRLNGSGVALGDVDGDGLCDLYLARLMGNNALYKNLGNWRFQSIGAQSGVECEGQYSSGSVLADFDGDGDLDLIVASIGTGTQLFLNDGQGKFAASPRSGLFRRGGATTMAIADVDRDGDLDLYVTNYQTTTIRTTGFALLQYGNERRIRPQDRQRLEITPEGRVLEHGEPDILYLNDGQARFQPVSWTRGRFRDADGKPLTRPPFDWGLAAMFRDMDQDGDPDLYVCNDFHSEDKIWLNDGTGHFQLMPVQGLRHTSTFSMAIDFSDLDRDGRDDFFVADMLSPQHERRMMQLAAMDPYRSEIGVFMDRPQFDQNTLQWNRGDGTYADIATYAGLVASDWTWSAIFLDVDLDGYEDLLCSTGHLFDTQDMDAEKRIRAKSPWPQHLIPQKLLMFPKMKQANQAFRNRGDLTFEPAAREWGFADDGVSHGMALGDLDNDGDLDLVVNNLNAPVGLYRNDVSKPRVQIQLKGLGKNTYGIGARLTLSDGELSQSQVLLAGGRYLSGDQAVRVFACPEPAAEWNLEVRWPSGRVDRLGDLEPNSIYEISESELESGDASEAMAQVGLDGGEPLFEDWSDRLGHRHQERAFGDFEAAPLLPWRRSQSGPGLVWVDVDRDGWDDLIVGTGAGGQLGFRRNQSGRFEALTSGDGAVERRDTTGLATFCTAPERRWLVVGASNYEDGYAQSAGVSLRPVGDMQSAQLSLGLGRAVGPVAVADVNRDGHLDVFVGMGAGIREYPEAGPSELWLGDGETFWRDEDWAGGAESLGLVRGASFGDVNGDGAPDLVLATEWGPVRLLLNEAGRLVDRTEAWGLGGTEGWWNGVAVGDFNADGRLDFVATNWGQNHGGGARPVKPSPRSLYFGDLDEDRQRDLIEAYPEPRTGQLMPVQHFSQLAQELAFIPRRFSDLAAANRASLTTVLGAKLATAERRVATVFQHALFLNQGDRMVMHALPTQAQWAPAFGVLVGDIDLDGHQDVFLAQNFFAVQPFAARQDAGRGLWLRGVGMGAFEPLSAEQSGVRVYGEQRGAALADFDQDGRLDFAVAQNGGETKLFRNQAPRVGLRVTLNGSSTNPDAIGASVRGRYGERLGALQSVQAGTGYWSQSSRVMVLAREGLTHLQIRWPDGGEVEIPVQQTNRAVVVGRDGSVEEAPEP